MTRVGEDKEFHRWGYRYGNREIPIEKRFTIRGRALAGGLVRHSAGRHRFLQRTLMRMQKRSLGKGNQ